MKKIAFVSAAGGAGCSTLTALVSMAYAAQKKQTIVFELNAQNDLSYHYGVSAAPEKGLSDVVTEGATAWAKNTLRHRDGIVVVPYGKNDHSTQTNFNSMLLKQVDWLSNCIEQIDLDATVLIDAGKITSITAQQAMQTADISCIVFPLQPTAYIRLSAIEERIKTYQAKSINNQKTVLYWPNLFNPSTILHTDILTFLTDQLKERVLPALHYDGHIPEAFAKRENLIQHAPHSRAFADLQQALQRLD